MDDGRAEATATTKIDGCKSRGTKGGDNTGVLAELAAGWKGRGTKPSISKCRGLEARWSR